VCGLEIEEVVRSFSEGTEPYMDEEPVALVDLPGLAREDFCYLTTIGRVTGKPHTIEIWFGLNGRTLYMLSGGRDSSDWVKNIRRRPQVTVRIGEVSFGGFGRVVEDPEEDTLARRLLVDKYRSGSRDLTKWGRIALPMAVDV
jgi:deazaflavin-dependent oxidoreductase (nitroreductase family)